MAKKTLAADEAATVQPTVNREPMADVSEAPALADPNNPEATDGDTQQSTDDLSDGGQPAAHPLSNASEKVTMLVAMRRDAPLHDNGPTTADVHPDEVAHWQAYAWELAE